MPGAGLARPLPTLLAGSGACPLTGAASCLADGIYPKGHAMRSLPKLPESPGVAGNLLLPQGRSQITVQAENSL